MGRYRSWPHDPERIKGPRRTLREMEDPEIEVTATEIAETRDYKGRSKAKERDTEKTLERATHTHTHTHRPHFTSL